MGKRRSYDGYAENFQERAEEVKQRAGNRCECCGVKAGMLKPIKRGKWKGVKFPVFLNAAHLNGDKWNPDAELLALCPECHGTFDKGSAQERQRIRDTVRATRLRRKEPVAW